ncbi:hypothetical protein THTE_0511 [Thermogutta terrifontis]|uniref:Uncharacterized protein n=1 Tax=Thermogutta terrifontis TaxID=1331910 RepID=A0A286RAX7_9BACT|nr:hypothetical protein THTE_0511 [Thermogutta terrifontis]
MSGPYSEGRACHVRLSTLEDQPQFTRASVGAIHELPLQRPAIMLSRRSLQKRERIA